MVNSNKHVFWQAVIFSIFIFVIGFIVGYFVEESRYVLVRDYSVGAENALLDFQVANSLSSSFDFSCDKSKEMIFEFADDIYQDALATEEYVAVAKFTSSLDLAHERYDLLRLILWNNALEVRKRCGADFHTVIYFYDYKATDSKYKAKESYIEKLTRELKSKYPDDLLLIPISINSNLISLDKVSDEIRLNEIPSILIDENVFIYSNSSLDQIEKIIFKSNNK